MNHFFRLHRKLLTSALVGAVAFLFLPAQWTIISRILVCWNTGVVLFLILVFSHMGRLTPEQIRLRYIEEDESAPFILVLVIVAALLSVIAIVDPLARVKQVAGAERIAHMVVATLTLVDSWLLVPTIFTTHYADMFYSEKPDESPLIFPKTQMPAFWDFAYFSFTIAAACQTSDISTTQSSIRKVVLAHTLISFLFNASILGFAINVTAGLIGGS